MFWKEVLLAICLLLEMSLGSRRMTKLADKKLCADEDCSHPVSIAVALSDYTPPDCRFIPIRQGQTLYIFSKLKGRGRLFWLGSVQGDYYGEQAARLGYFPSTIVQEEHYLMPAKVEVSTDSGRCQKYEPPECWLENKNNGMGFYLPMNME